MIGMFLLVSCQSAATPVVQKTDIVEQPAVNIAAPATEVVSVSTAPAGTDQGESLPTVDPMSITGDIVSAGSSTVYPLSERMASRFENEGFSGNITIDSIGTGAGFERFCVNGETDISNASRPIKDSELEQCRTIGREPVEFRIGTDAVAVVVSSQNTFVTDVTMEELALIFGAANTWSDVRPEWPNEPIQRFIPGTDSGTFDYFVEMVFEKDPTALLAASNTQLSEDDNVLVQGVEGSPYAIGYFGYAYYANNSSALKILNINGIEPVEANVDNFSYPLARPLFIYSTAEIMQKKPQVAAFINYYLTYVDEEISSVGYFPANQQALEQSVKKWLTAMGE
jgi:phosphate transport system substrate-binding protein